MALAARASGAIAGYPAGVGITAWLASGIPTTRTHRRCSRTCSPSSRAVPHRSDSACGRLRAKMGRTGSLRQQPA